MYFIFNMTLILLWHRMRLTRVPIFLKRLEQEWPKKSHSCLNIKYFTRGLYYKTFYGSDCCRIVISQSVCHILSLPSWPIICGQDQKRTISAESSMGLYSGMIEPYPQILDQGGSDRKWQTLQLITIQQQLLL